MNNRAFQYAALFVFASALSIALSSLTLAQVQPREKPKLKNFGESLKRLKWDENKKAAVEEQRREDKTTNPRDDDVVRIETSLVVCDVLVLDQRGQPVPGLTDKDFALTEDAKPQQIGAFSLGDNATVPRSIVLIIDYSGSQLPYINTSVEAAKTLVDQLGPKDRMAIVTDDVRLLVDFTDDKTNLKSNLESLKSAALSEDAKRGWFRGHSLQFSALMATLKEAFDDEDQRPIIIFQTDGDETTILQPLAADTPSTLKAVARQFGLADVFRAVEKSRATIYTVVPGFRLIGLSPEEQMRRIRAMLYSSLPGRAGGTNIRNRENDRRPVIPPEFLKRELEIGIRRQSALAEVATLTGGWISFLEQPTQADEIYSHIFSDINRRYIVGYYPTNKVHDGKRRKVKVEVRGHPDYILIGRKSYLAPEPEQ